MPLKKPTDIKRHEEVQDLMNVDVFDSVEKITGRRVDSDKLLEQLSVGLHLQKGALMRKVMVDLGDFTHVDMWERRRTILERHGFQEIYRYDFVTDAPHSYYVYLEAENGLVFTQETAFRSVNGDVREYNADHGHCHFCWSPSDGKSKMPVQMSGGWESVKFPNWRTMKSPDPKKMFFTPDDLYFRGYVDGTTGMIHNLQTLVLRGKFLNPWPRWDCGKNPLATFLTNSEDHKHAESQRIFSVERLAFLSALNTVRYDSLPLVARVIMNFVPTWRKDNLQHGV